MAKIEPLDMAYEKWSRTRTPETMAHVVKEGRGIISSALRSYAGGQDTPSIRAAAKRLFIHAVRQYRRDRGTKLRSFAMTQMQPLRRLSMKSSQLVGVPERQALAARDMATTERELEVQLGRPPSDDEMADRMGLSVQRLNKIRTANRPSVSESTLRDEEGAQYLPGVVREDPYELWIELVHHTLPAPDKKILDWTLGRNGHPKLSKVEIARRLRVSPSAVTQRAQRIAALVEQGEKLERLNVAAN